MHDFIDKVLRDLIAIDSSPHADKKKIIKYAAKITESFGMVNKIYGEDEPSLLAQFGEGGVHLSGHLDTVPIGDNWKHKQGEKIKGRIYGRGALDMKGSCASMLETAKRLIANKTNFSLSFTTDEETTMRGAELIAKTDAIKNAQSIVICEPTNFDVITYEKGVYQFKLITHGKKAHASMPDLGENAILKMNKLMSSLRDLTIPPKDLLNEVSLNVSKIVGGEKINVVPDECILEIDARFPPTCSFRDVKNMIEEKLSTTDINYEWGTIHELPPVKVNSDLKEVKKMLRISRGKIGGVAYATEMVRFFLTNQKVMVCGPGDPKRAHTMDEYIELKDLYKAADIYEKYAMEMSDC